MRRIRNVRKAWRRLGDLIERHAQAVRQHKPRLDLQAEMRAVRESIIHYELRQERKLIARGVSVRAAHGSDHRKMACGPLSDFTAHTRSRPSA